MSEAAYDIYQLLRTLIQRAAWPTQGEQTLALESVDAAERVQLFGNMAKIIACTHERVTKRCNTQSVCMDCGKIM